MVRAFKMRLEYGMGPEFEKRHAEVWPKFEHIAPKLKKLAKANGGIR